MPDCSNFIPPSSSNPRPRRKPASPGGRKPTLSEAQDAIQDAADQLRQLDKRLAQICGRLPESARGFDLLTELRGTVDCVRSDLLADAIATLSVAATASETDLHRSFEERQRWLVAVAM